MIYDKSTNRSYYIGGISVSPINKMYFFDHLKMKWIDLREITCKIDKNLSYHNPNPTSYHTSVLHNNEILNFGGEKEGVLHNSIWSFNLKTLVWNIKYTIGDVRLLIRFSFI